MKEKSHKINCWHPSWIQEVLVDFSSVFSSVVKRGAHGEMSPSTTNTASQEMVGLRFYNTWSCISLNVRPASVHLCTIRMNVSVAHIRIDVEIKFWKWKQDFERSSLNKFKRKRKVFKIDISNKARFAWYHLCDKLLRIKFCNVWEGKETKA